jgi:hypothetical protein
MFSLKMKGMKSRAIDGDRVTTLHDEAFGDSTVTLWLCQERLAPCSEPNRNSADSLEVSKTDKDILSVLIAEQFASVLDIARLADLPHSTVHWYLTRSLRFTVRHLHLIEDLMTNESKHN